MENTGLLYDLNDRPKFAKLIALAMQQLLAILAGTITMPLIIGNGLSQSAALFGACVGTFFYLIITRFKSPVFLGSSYTYIGSMMSAFGGAATFGLAHEVGFLGIFMGAAFGGLVYVILSVVVHFVGTKWIDKIMPPVIIGPIVALIGLTLAPNAINSIAKGNVFNDMLLPIANPYLCLFIGLLTLAVAIICSVHAKGFIRLIPFMCAIIVSYLVALTFTLIGNAANIDAFKIIDLTPFKNIQWVPDFTFFHFGDACRSLKETGGFWKYTMYIFSLYVPIAFAVFAEHIADHENLSTVIGRNLLEEPGLSKTLMGDGVGSLIGAMFGGCPNTTYGESISCVAFSRNASIITILTTCILGIAFSFLGPVMAFFNTIPTCIIGGLSIALYGYIASSGLRMLKEIDLSDLKNIFVISTIFIIGIGGMVISYRVGELSPIACALVFGILVNLLVKIPHKNKENNEKSPENP